jgi:hypothetical protein
MIVASQVLSGIYSVLLQAKRIHRPLVHWGRLDNLYGLSLSKILQEAGITEADIKKRYLSGGIQSLEELLRPENLTKLESLHVGIFCFLAFHPRIDKFVTEYVEKGSIASHGLVL